MVNYESYSNIIERSLIELQEIARYLHEREYLEVPVTVLIGGWAVHSYNPWYGSIDIDLITNSRTRASLQEHLVKNRGFVRDRKPDDTKYVKKSTSHGSIIIDFGTREREDPFEGHDLRISYGLLDGRTTLKPIGNGLVFPVPERTTLMFLKLKAASDREYRIENDISHDIEWERGKLKKDRADILALLDPGSGGHEVDVSFLGAFMEKYPFLIECLKKVALDVEAVEFYRRMSQDSAEVLIERVLSLIG
jgi:hypothetical protein